MAYTKTTWEKRIVTTPDKYALTDLGGGNYTIEPVPGAVTQEGTPLTEVYLNNLETQYDEAVDLSFRARPLVFTRVMTATSGDVAYSGAGFQPTALHIMVNAGSAYVSIGVSDPDKNMAILHNNDAGGAQGSSTYLVHIQIGDAHHQQAILRSYDADGFTLTWTKTGSPTGTARIFVIAMR